jgi:crotonobetainyl-CoA:carnitine CoA-transferase CaiB-like acyl-CoA transferase
MTARSDGILAGVRVVDISETVAGAYCTRLLAGFGADVTLVERPNTGHPLRRLGPFPHERKDDLELSAAHLYFNAGKASVTADIRSTEGSERVLSLIAGAELLVESLTERQSVSLGLTPESLRQSNPALHILSVTPWGRTGPHAERPGSELTVEALGGIAGMHGEPPREPLLLPGWQIECFAGVFAAAGAVAALLDSSSPRLVEVSSLEASVNALETRLAGWAYTGRRPRRALESVDRFYPVNVWPCKDGYLALAFYHTRDWEGLTLVLGDEELQDAERFGSNSRRLRNREALDRKLGAILSDRTMREVFEGSVPLRSAVGMVLDARSLLEDPHLRARGAFVEVEHPVARKYKMPAAPFLLSEGGWHASRAPLLGEHSGQMRTDEPRPRTDPPRAQHGFRPLDDVRVLELSTAWAGPTAGRVLGGLGADVLKIESCTWWDAWRGTAMASSAGFGVYADNDPGDWPYERTPLFGAANRNKRGLTLDLSKPQGRSVFLRLVEKSDVVLSNFSARVLPNLGLGYEALRKTKPDIILLRMPAFGASGPYRDGVGYGNTIEAMGGLAARFGYSDGPPQITHDLTFGDPVAGIHGALSVLVALHYRRRTGRGVEIDLSQQETMIAQQGEALVKYSLDGQVLGRLGSKAYAHAPHGYYPCAGKDEWIAISTADDDTWKALQAGLGRPDWITEARFSTNERRLAAQDQLDALLGRETATHEKVALAERLAEAGVDAAPVLNFEEIREHPQAAARQAFEAVNHPIVGLRLLPRLPFTVDGYAMLTLRHAPLFGQNNEEILSGLLGLSNEDLNRLRASFTIGDRPTEARPNPGRSTHSSPSA